MQILCENNKDVLVTLREGKLFGEVSTEPLATKFKTDAETCLS